MNKHGRIAIQLLAGFGVLCAVALGLGCAWIVQSIDSAAQADRTVSTLSQEQKRAGSIGNASNDMMTAANGVIFASILQQTDALQLQKKRFQQSSDGIHKSLEELRPLCSQAAKADVDAVAQLAAAASTAFSELLSDLDKQQFDAAQTAFDKSIQPRLREVSGKLDALMGKESNRLPTELHAREARSFWTIAMSLGVVLVTAVGVLINLKRITGGLRALAGEIDGDASRVAHAAGKLSGAGRSLAQCSTEEAAALDRATGAMDDIRSATHKNTDSTGEAAVLMKESQEMVKETERTVRELTGTMREITESGKKINTVVGLIDRIAFQTKILAFNATIEAAHAGAAGAGFGVVAQQVSILAEECAQAAEGTAAMVAETIARVHDGAGKLELAASEIQKVVEQTGRMRMLVDAINAGSQEQTRGVEGVAETVEQMRQMIVGIVSGANDTAQFGQELDGDAKALNLIVARMNQMVGRAS